MKYYTSIEWKHDPIVFFLKTPSGISATKLMVPSLLIMELHVEILMITESLINCLWLVFHDRRDKYRNDINIYLVGVLNLR